MPKVTTIDNHEIEVPEGTTILQAARMIGRRYLCRQQCAITLN
jgi:NADH dehydrogenase/NADH:ubiquinone oxidoreductase subunit G